MTKKQKNICEVLSNYKNTILEDINDISADFCGDYENYIESSDQYFCDAFNDYADNRVSVYYSDQKEFYFNNEDQCLEALDEFGYTGETLSALLKDCGGLDELIAKAGAIGEYADNNNKLYEDEENIKRYLLLAYIVENWEQFSKGRLKRATLEEWITFVDDVANANIERISDLIEYINEWEI